MLKLANAPPADEGPADGFDPLKAVGLSRARLKMRGQGADPRPPTTETLRRWIRYGCRPAGPNGPLLKLQGRLYSGHFLVMPEWVERFEAERLRLSRIDPLADEVPNRTREAQKRAAELALDRAGIGSKRSQ